MGPRSEAGGLRQASQGQSGEGGRGSGERQLGGGEPLFPLALRRSRKGSVPAIMSRRRSLCGERPVGAWREERRPRSSQAFVLLRGVSGSTARGRGEPVLRGSWVWGAERGASRKEGACGAGGRGPGPPYLAPGGWSVRLVESWYWGYLVEVRQALRVGRGKGGCSA